MRHPATRRTLAAAGLSAATALSLLPTLPAGATPLEGDAGATAAASRNCYAYSSTFASDTNLWQSGYGYGRSSSMPVYQRWGKSGFLPTAYTESWFFVLGDSVPLRLAISPAGNLWHLSTVTDPASKAEYNRAIKRVKIASNWGALRLLTVSDNTEATDAKPVYLYAVTKAGALRRYTVRWPKGLNVSITGATTIATTGYADVTSMSWARTAGVVRSGRAQTADMILMTTSSGKLKEISVPRVSTTAIRTVVLRSSGFRGVDSITSGSCESGSGRYILATTKANRGLVYWDANARDFAGKDISYQRAITVKSGRHFAG